MTDKLNTICYPSSLIELWRYKPRVDYLFRKVDIQITCYCLQILEFPLGTFEAYGRLLSIIIIYSLRKMENAYYALSEDQIQFFQKHGYLIIRAFLTSSETQGLQQWAQEVHDLPRTEDATWMPYEVGDISRDRKMQPL